ncbi:MAG: hypothetical protein WCP28_19265 [Actinomycetes bacterium]
MLSAGSMAIDTCCSVPGATMAPSTCPSGSQRPDFKAVSAVPEVLSPAVPLGAAFMVGPGLGKGSSLGGIANSARGPGDRLAGTRLRV